jgi:hypothetical protein
MNKKFQEPTLEQLRSLLSGHPDLLNHIKSEKSLDRVGREKLMQLIDLCGLSTDQGKAKTELRKKTYTDGNVKMTINLT